MFLCICEFELCCILVWFQGKTCARMPGKPETGDWRVQHSEQLQFQSSIHSHHHQPWWHGVGGIETASKSSSADQLNGSIMNNGVTHSEANNEDLADGVDFNKQRQPMVSPSLSVTEKSGVCIFDTSLDIFCLIIMYFCYFSFLHTHLLFFFLILTIWINRHACVSCSIICFGRLSWHNFRPIAFCHPDLSNQLDFFTLMNI